MAKGLGRGLGALLGSDAGEAAPESAVHTLRVSDIEPNPKQPRRDFDEEALQALADSIRDNGLLQPLLVRRVGNGFQLIAGERRWRAARRAGLLELPAIILEADDRRMTELALIENLQREDLNPLEEAESYRVLTEEFGLSQAEAAQKVGKSRPAVANAIRLLSLPDDVRAMLRDGRLSAGHARALLTLEDTQMIRELATRVADNSLSVRQTEKLAAAWKAAAEKPKKKKSEALEEGADPLGETRERLSGLYGRRVTFRPGKGKGYVMLEYYDNDDLDTLITQLMDAAGGK
ncbi:MAG: ParB/RepB/Spo0J family partition protein [Clostridiaceae bacterium]|nr:ParB/RepB/Spo0J family partition protein [Clostridiaceae bacterium]